MCDYDHFVHFEEGAHSDSTDDPNREVRSPGSVMSDSYYENPDGNAGGRDSCDNNEPEDSDQREDGSDLSEGDGCVSKDDDDASNDFDKTVIVSSRRNVRFQAPSAIPRKATTRQQPTAKNQNHPAPTGLTLPNTIDACLDELGLIPSTESPDARIDFNNDLTAFFSREVVKQPHGKKDETIFPALVKEFGDRYGLKYWGANNRDRLTNRNVETGFSSSCEALEPKKRFMVVLRHLLGLKAKIVRQSEKRRRQGRKKKRPASSSIAGQPAEKRRAAIIDRGSDAVEFRSPQTLPKLLSATKPINAKAGIPTPETPVESALITTIHGSLGGDASQGRQLPVDPVAEPTMPIFAESASGTTKALAEADSQAEMTGSSITVPQTSTQPSPLLVQEPTAVSKIKQQLAAIEQRTKIYMMVSASTQSERAPVYVRYHSNLTSHDIFDHVVSKCRVTPGKVDQISATLRWRDGTKLLIRQGEQDDIDFMQEWICQAWADDSARFKNGVEIRILLHVDL
ncbi:MAG: hypothetical protein Q9207_000263 [Kuettlingeria erythrocarpa]